MYMLRFLDQKSSVQKYIMDCKVHENASKEDESLNYSLFVHGNLLPWFDDLRKEGKLKKGKQ